MGERRGMKALELWAKRVTDGYPGVKVDNMTTSWRDGLAFCALIHHFRPDLIDFDRLDKRDILKNNELAFRVAERQLGIPALLDAEDMVEYEIPDRLSILTYLSQFYQVFAQQGTSPSPRKHNTSVTDILSPSTNTTNVKVGRGRVERCHTCDRPVFLAERLLVGGKLRHRSCFTCARCAHLLNPVSCYETETGDFVCEMCPDENVKRDDHMDGTLDAELAPNSAPHISNEKVRESAEHIQGNLDAESAPHNIGVQKRVNQLESTLATHFSNENVQQNAEHMKSTSFSASFESHNQEPQLKLPIPSSEVPVDEVAPLVPDSGGPIPTKPPDPFKQKFLKDILDGDKTEISSDSGLSEMPSSFISNRLDNPDTDKSNLTTVSLVNDNVLVDNARKEVEEPIKKGEDFGSSDNEAESALDNIYSEETLEEHDNEEVSLEKLTIVTTDAQELEKLTINEEPKEEDEVEILTHEVEKSIKIEDSIEEPVENLELPTNDIQTDPSKESEHSGETSSPEEENLKIEDGSREIEALTATVPDVTVSKATEEYPTDLNPFDDDDDEKEEEQCSKNPFDESEEEEEFSPAKPVPSPRSCKKVQVNADGKTVVEAPKNLNPFWSGSDDEEESTPTPTPRRSLLTPDPSLRYGSTTSLTSQSSSAGKKKKRPAPQPPGEGLLRRPSSPVSSLSSPSRSPVAARRRKSRAPPPPPTLPSDKERKDLENKVKQKQLSPPSDKSTYGKWKRKKGAAPGLPIPPQRRRIVVLPIGDLNQEVDDLEVQQTELERQGVKLELTIRRIEEGGEEQNGAVGPEKDIEEMVLQLFEIVNQKNELFRRQAELMFLRKQQRLEDEHADIEYQIRCLMGRPKDQADPMLEEELIRRLVDVVERRNEIIECLDMNRRRAVEEDQSIHDTLMAYTARNAVNVDSTTEEEAPAIKKSTKSVLKLIKKKKEKKREKLEMEKKKNDADVDIDESETKEVKTKTKKWFKLEK